MLKISRFVVEYPDEFENKNLYKEPEIKPIKVNMPQFKELYGDETNTKSDYSQHEVEAEIDEEGVIESFADFNENNSKKVCKVNWLIIPVLFVIILIGLLFLKV